MSAVLDATLVGTGVGTPATANLPVIDLEVPAAPTGHHIVPILTGTLAAAQEAQVLCIMVLGSIPQLPSAGVDWPGFLAGTNEFGALDASIRANLNAGGQGGTFYPDYSINPGGPNGDYLTVTALQQPLSGVEVTP